jgi:flagellar hook-length control protein FliK
MPQGATSSPAPIDPAAVMDAAQAGPTRDPVVAAESSGPTTTFEPVDLADAGTDPSGTALATRAPDAAAARPAPTFAAHDPAAHAAASVERVAVAIRHAANQGMDRIEIKLHPEHLGRVDITLDLGEGNQVQATVSAERSATHELLQREARGLERALEQAGLKVQAGDLTFSWRHGGQPGHGFDQGNRQPSHPWIADGSMGLGADDTTTPPATWRDPSRLIDLRA